MNMSPERVFFIIISSPHTRVLKHKNVCILLDVLSAALESDTLWYSFEELFISFTHSHTLSGSLGRVGFNLFSPLAS